MGSEQGAAERGLIFNGWFVQQQTLQGASFDIFSEVVCVEIIEYLGRCNEYRRFHRTIH